MGDRPVFFYIIMMQIDYNILLEDLSLFGHPV
jgi:hypothetical protein